VRIEYAQLTAAKVSNPKFRRKRGNSPDISKGISQSGMCKFESSEVNVSLQQDSVRAFLDYRGTAAQADIDASLHESLVGYPTYHHIGRKLWVISQPFGAAGKFTRPY
jgi:hypothetical protein